MGKYDIARVHAAGRFEPAWWVETALGVTLTPDQREYFDALPGHRRVHLRSGHGTGKTFALAATALWFGSTRCPARIITTAAVGRQVRRQLWGELPLLHAQARVPLPGRVQMQSWELPEGGYAVGFSTDHTDRFTGVHGENVLFLLDEGQMVPAEILLGMKTSLQSQGVLCIFAGNPVARTGAFWDEYESGRWHCMKFSAERHPNVVEGREVIPGAVTGDWIEEMRQEWGEASPAYVGRVTGEFPEAGSYGLIEPGWLTEAVARYNGGVARTIGSPVLGIDVAGFGDDLSVWIVRDDASVLCIESEQIMDPVQVAKRGLRLAVEWKVAPENVHIDMTGEGHGTVAYCHERGVLAHGVHFGGRAWNSSLYVNCRAEMYCQLRDALNSAKGGQLALTEHKSLLAELRATGYKFDAKERYQITAKEEIKKRLGRSPDYADALALTFTTGARAWVA